MNKNKINDFLHLMLRFQHYGEQIPPFEKLGISPAQVVYIDYLARHAPCSLTQLTEGLGFKAASVSVMINVLESKKLISKGENAQDKRSILLTLTSKGQRLFAQIDQYRRQKVEMLLSKLTEEEQDQFLTLFKKTIQ